MPTNCNNLLYGSTTYLIGPMEFLNGEKWRDEATLQLNKIGVKVLNPYKSPFLFAPLETSATQTELKNKLSSGDDDQIDSVHQQMKQIVRFDLACVDRSDFLIAYINKDIPTFGSMNELSLARMLKKPVFLIVEGGISNCPLWLCGMFPPRYIYKNLDDVIRILFKINSQEIPIDSERWRLLRHDLR